MASKLRSSSPTAGWRSRLRPLRWNLTLCEAQCWRNSSLLGGEFADEGDEGFVVRVASCFESEHVGGVGGYAVVVDEELPGRPGRGI